MALSHGAAAYFGPMTMAATIPRLIALGCAVCALAGCSRDAATERAEHAAVAMDGLPPVVRSVCEQRILKLEDVAGILNEPVTGTKSVPGDAQSCEFTTASFPAIVISVRPGLGRSTLDAWAAGRMPLNSSPLAGVGDGAVWVDTLHEVVAQKNAVLCDIRVRAGTNDLAASATGLSVAIGALCEKIFMAY
jgi:hypothetical protein